MNTQEIMISKDILTDLQRSKLTHYSIFVYSSGIILLLSYWGYFCHASPFTYTTFAWKRPHECDNKTPVYTPSSFKDNFSSIAPKMSTPPFVIPAEKNHSATLIFLHGLADTGKKWSEVFAKIKQPYMKIICPNANSMPVTIHNETRLYSWFDEKYEDLYEEEDIEGIVNASNYLGYLVEMEMKSGIPPSRIIVGGWGQGGAVALQSGLSHPQKLAGILALSAWLPMYNLINLNMNPDNENIPILQCHGENDKVIPFEFAFVSCTILKRVSEYVEFLTFEGKGHDVTHEVISHAKRFLEEQIKPT